VSALVLARFPQHPRSNRCVTGLSSFRASAGRVSRFGGKATILPVLRSPSDDVSTFRGESVRGRDYDVG
jgi:hypothetical protein